MKIESLEAHNIDRDLLDIWRRTVGERLLPVQERAVKEFGLLGSRNLIVFSPTSSGKTFVGEMAAVHAARQNRKVFYLVPLKALAEEKYQEFRQRYALVSIRVIVSSRDHSEFDSDIVRLDFDIAVVVYEKLQSLLVGHPSLIERTSLVVVDELQLITDPTRWPSLELLLTKLITANWRPRIIGLSAVLGRAEILAEWLEAKLLVEHHRPVELRKGVLCRGTFTYREHNSGQMGTEQLPDLGDISKNEAKLAAAEHLVGLGEQVLVFEETRTATVQNATLMADRLRLPIVQEGVEALTEREETLASRNLRRALESSVAFHNSDLSPEDRALVERLFRAGDIRVIFSTPTLAMGMNLPAKNVIVPADKWTYLKRYRNWCRMELSKSDYENMSGRAGRFSLTPDFGRSILVTDSRFAVKVWMDCFVDADIEAIQPTLKDAPLAEHLLDILASELAATPAEASDLLMRSFTGQTWWNLQLSQQEFQEHLTKAIDECQSAGLLEQQGGTLSVTQLGKVCATTGLKVPTAEAFARWLSATADLPIAPLDVLTALTFTPDADGSYVPMTGREPDNREYKDQLMREAQRLGLLERPLLQEIRESRFSLKYDEAKRVKKALILHAWMQELKTADIERAYLVWAGAIKRVAEEYGWLAEALAQAAGALGWSKPRQRELRRLSLRISRGVKEDLLPLARLRVRGLGRVYLRRLAEAGLADHAAVKLASQDELQMALNHRGLAERLHEHLHRVEDGDDAGDEAKDTAVENEGTSKVVVAAEAVGACPRGAVVQELVARAVQEPASYSDSRSVAAPVSRVAEESPGYGSGCAGPVHTLHFVGTCQRRRYPVQIDGRDAWLPNQALRVLSRLAAQRRADPSGWVHQADLGVASGAHRALSRLRRFLDPHRAQTGDCWIENDGHGAYRLSGRIAATWDETMGAEETPDSSPLKAARSS